MPLYKPPTRVTTTEIPLLAEVVRADPDFERKKHRELEYPDGGGRWAKYADPYKRGAYSIPNKLSLVTLTGPATFAAGDMTGVGYDFVSVLSEAATPGVLTTRSGDQLFSDIAGAVPNLGYALRVINFTGTSPMTLMPGASILIFDSRWDGQLVPADIINPGNFTDFQVQFPDSGHALFRRVSVNQPYSAIVG